MKDINKKLQEEKQAAQKENKSRVQVARTFNKVAERLGPNGDIVSSRNFKV